MPRYCDGCGRVRRGPCKKVCREAIDTFTFESGVTLSFQRGDASATQVPPLDGMVFFNDDGTGIPRQEQEKYDQSMCKRGAPYPLAVQGPRPNGWDEALEAIAQRAAQDIHGGLPEC